MNEKKNKYYKQNDFRLKYPVDRILFIANSQDISIRKLAQMFSLSPSTIHKIIHKCGSNELLEKTNKRSKRNISETIKEQQNDNAVKFLGQSGQICINMLKPADNITEAAQNVKEISKRSETVLQNIEKLISKINDRLDDKYTETLNLVELKDELVKTKSFDIKLMRLSLDGWKEFVSIQEKFIKIEVIAKQVESVRFLLDTLFDSLKSIDYKLYIEFRNKVVEIYPSSQGLFNQFEDLPNNLS